MAVFTTNKDVYIGLIFNSECTRNRLSAALRPDPLGVAHS